MKVIGDSRVGQFYFKVNNCKPSNAYVKLLFQKLQIRPILAPGRDS